MRAAGKVRGRSFTDRSRSRLEFGSLLLRYEDEGRLVFAGNVGTGKGLTLRVMTALRVELNALEQAEWPNDVRPPRPIAQRAYWVRPVLPILLALRFTMTATAWSVSALEPSFSCRVIGRKTGPSTRPLSSSQSLAERTGQVEGTLRGSRSTPPGCLCSPPSALVGEVTPPMDHQDERRVDHRTCHFKRS
jgi:hypothetical protein